MNFFKAIVVIIFMSNFSTSAETSFNVADGVFSWLGSGHDTIKQKTAATCITYNDSDLEYVGADGKIDLEFVTDSNKVDDFLGIGANGRARAGAVEYSAKAEFSRDSKSNDYSLSYNYISEFNDKRAIKSATIHPSFEHLVADGRDALAWKETCGNEFVFATEKGARLFMNMKITFSSKEEKKRIAAELGAKGPSFEANGKFEQISNKMSSNSKLKISVYQLGGNPAMLGNIFCRDNSDTSCNTESIKVADCTMGDVKKCLNLISSFVAYTGNDFKQQIQDQKKYSVLKVYTRPYFMLGGKFPRVNEQSSALFEQEIQELIEYFNEQLELWVYSSDLYKDSVPRKTVDQKNNLEILKSKLNMNASLLAEAINGCYDYGLNYCVEKKKIVLRKLGVNENGTRSDSFITKKQIEKEVQPLMLSQFCDMRLENKKYEKTIDFLIGNVVGAAGKLDNPELIEEIKKYKNAQTDWCQKLQDDLQELENLRIVGLKDVSVEVISTLKNLKELSLVDLDVNDFSHLVSLQNLTELKLVNTKVASLTFLSGMGKLNSLEIVGNRSVKRFDSILTIESLEQLVVFDNGNKFTCASVEVEDCVDLNYEKLISVYEYQNSSKCFFGFDLDFVEGYYGEGVDLLSVDSRGRLYNTNVATSSCRKVGTGNDDIFIKYEEDYKEISPFPKEELESELSNKSRVFTLNENNEYKSLFVAHANVFKTIKIAKKTNEYVSSTFSIEFQFSGSEVTRIDSEHFLVSGGVSKETPVGAVVVIHVNPETLEINPVKVSTLRIPRFKHQIYKISESKFLVLGGVSSGRAVAQIELLDLDYFSTSNNIDPRGATVVGNLKDARVGFSLTRIGEEQLLVAGGFSSLAEGAAAYRTAELINIKNYKAVKIKNEMSFGRGDFETVLINDGLVLIVGGATNYQKVLFSVEKPNSTNIGERKLLLTNKYALSAIEIYDISKKMFFKVGDLQNARTRFALKKYSSNSYVVLGGLGANSSKTSTSLEMISLNDLENEY